jgi:hypothetical protein
MAASAGLSPTDVVELLGGVNVTITKPRAEVFRDLGNGKRSKTTTSERIGSPLWFAARAVWEGKAMGKAGALELAKLLVEKGANCDASGKI